MSEQAAAERREHNRLKTLRRINAYKVAREALAQQMILEGICDRDRVMEVMLDVRHVHKIAVTKRILISLTESYLRGERSMDDLATAERERQVLYQRRHEMRGGASR